MLHTATFKTTTAECIFLLPPQLLQLLQLLLLLLQMRFNAIGGSRCSRVP